MHLRWALAPPGSWVPQCKFRLQFENDIQSGPMTQWNEYPLAGTGEPGQVALRVWPEVLSPQLRNYRDLLVALPPGYEDGGERHPVVYMQDGQNLFDPATS